ncbi:MAG: T9SS type A sorting domain-containing protein [Bacteroidales bacterium]|nr:T9SS type A sorting domain-containing protein [Bacteroidales bacterium]
MKNLTLSTLLVLMMTSATLFAQHSEREFADSGKTSNNHIAIKDAVVPGMHYSSSYYITKKLTIGFQEPDIIIYPLEFTESHFDPPQISTQILSISNTGSTPLSWYISTTGNNNEPAYNSKDRAIVWDNDFTVTAEGAGSQGSDCSGLPGIPFIIDAYPGRSENDVGVSAIIEPASGVTFTNEEPVTIKLENYGVAGQFDIPYEVSWSGPTGNETVNNIYKGYLEFGQGIEITLDETADLSAPGNYIFEACTQLSGDENPDNDCKTKLLFGPLPGNEWLSFDQFSGIINPGDTAFVMLSFDSETLEPGQYQDTITIHSNDPDQAVIGITVQLNVETGLIPPTNPSAQLLQIGEVKILWDFNPTKNLEHFNIYRNDELTGISEDTLFIDALPDFGTYTYSVTAQYPEGESEPAGPVQVEWPAEPHIVINPMELMETHACFPQITTQTLTVSNTGTATLDWELYIENEDSSKITGSALNTNNKTKNRDDLPWEDMYSSGCIYGDGLIYWNLENVLVPEIPCEGNPPWYHDYKDQVHLLEPGNTYSLTVQAGYDQTYFDVWINYNDDWYALDNELVLDDACCPNANQDYTFAISIPDTAAPGEHTLRFRTNWIDPVTHYFEKYSYGNCCDFTANISYNVSWLQADISSGAIEPGQSQQVTFTFDSWNLQLGLFSASVNFISNDPSNPLVEIPAALLANQGGITYSWNPESYQFLIFLTEYPEIDYLEIENMGTEILHLEFEIEYPDEPQNTKESWLSITPYTAYIYPGHSLTCTVSVYYWEFMSHHAEANILLYANDPCFPVQEIPVIVDLVGAIDESGHKTEISIFPNPANEVLNITSDVPMQKIKFVNTMGEEIRQENFEGNSFTLKTGDLPGGIYFIEIESKAGISMHKIVLK